MRSEVHRSPSAFMKDLNMDSACVACSLLCCCTFLWIWMGQGRPKTKYTQEAVNSVEFAVRLVHIGFADMFRNLVLES